MLNKRPIIVTRESQERIQMPTIVFWIDVDNTLLDNDAIKVSLGEAFKAVIGPTLSAYYWELYEQIRHEKSVVDIPLALERLREETPLSEMDDATYRHLHDIVDNYPFHQALYPNALKTL